MKKSKTLLFIGILILIIGGASLYYLKNSEEALPSFIKTKISTYRQNKKYIIKKAGQIVESADTLEEAKKKAKQIKRSIVINTYNNTWVYCDIEPYFIITDTAIHDFATFEEAFVYAVENSYTAIYYKDNKNIIWQADSVLKDTKLNIPLILQLPELPRGCEVTSLAMILQYRGIQVDKMKLASEVKRDSTTYSKDENGRIYYGNPYDGFVGDMYNAQKNGYGVYHGPISELAKQYAGDKAIDLTGCDFQDILAFVEKGNPVWVIVNSTYAPLGDEHFEIWHTPTGVIKITKKLHSVVITGFTENKIFINDPLYPQKNRSVDRESFKLAWEQMGNQAMTVIN